MTARSLASILVGLGLAAAGCGGSSSGGGTDTLTTPSPSASSPAVNAAGCTEASPETGSPQHFGSEPKVTVEPTTYTATVKTNCGTIVVDMDAKAAPHTVNSFAFLADKGYFDGTPCHRLTTSGIFVLQCGDPTGTGTGGPGYSIPDENLKGAKYPAGTVAMANAGPDTGGSQFFFVYADTQLPPSYTPFGKVVSGLNVLKSVAKQGSNPPGDGAPVQPVVIESFTVAKSG